VPFFTARSIVSFGMLAPRALSTAERRPEAPREVYETMLRWLSARLAEHAPTSDVKRGQVHATAPSAGGNAADAPSRASDGGVRVERSDGEARLDSTQVRGAGMRGGHGLHRGLRDARRSPGKLA
jgi:hypothetical protein